MMIESALSALGILHGFFSLFFAYLSNVRSKIPIFFWLLFCGSLGRCILRTHLSLFRHVSRICCVNTQI